MRSFKWYSSFTFNPFKILDIILSGLGLRPAPNFSIYNEDNNYISKTSIDIIV